MAVFEQNGVVRWSETDASGRFHYPSALIWAENAEHALYREIAPDLDLTSVPRRAVAASYLRAFTCGDAYTVRLSVEKIGHTSVSYAWQVLKDGAPAVEGQHSVVHVGPDGRSAPISDALRDKLRAYLHEGDER